MNRLGSLLLSFCLLSIIAVAEIANADCPSGRCGSSSLQYGPSVQESRATGGSITYTNVVDDSRSGFSVYGIDQYSDCRPGQCYLYYELVSCTPDNYSCIDGTRRIWSYRPLYYPRDNRELLINLDKKLCPNQRNCMWPYSFREQY